MRVRETLGRRLCVASLAGMLAIGFAVLTPPEPGVSPLAALEGLVELGGDRLELRHATAVEEQAERAQHLLSGDGRCAYRISAL